MKFLLAYGLLLGLAALISERTRTTVLSTSALFLVAGYVLGGEVLGFIELDPADHVVGRIAKLALFTLLFVEGSKLPISELRSAWRLPTRTLLYGMPLTVLALALAARLVLQFDWGHALLLAAILSPTDPVFAAAILEFDAVPVRLRHMLGVESGLNDGLALPIVMLLLASLDHEPSHPLRIVSEVVAGVAVGWLVPALFHGFERLRVFSVSSAYQPLYGVAIAILIYSVCQQLDANEYLSAYAAGVTLASSAPTQAQATAELGSPVAESFKLAAVLAFGSVLSVTQFTALGWRGAVFLLLALLVARPLALSFTLIGRSLSVREWISASWFGPKGFASIVYAGLTLQSGVADARTLVDVVSMVTATSILAHSSTDLWVARVFKRKQAHAKA